MARYRVKALSYINNVMVKEGDEVEYDGIPHSNLEPLDKPGKDASAKTSEADKESVLRSRAAAAGVNVSDSEEYARWRAEQKVPA